MRVVFPSAVRPALLSAGLVLLVATGGFRAPDPTPTVFDDPALVQEYQQVIQPNRLAEWVDVLASDSLAGRETGTRGQHEAARYLAASARKLGLAPPGGASGEELEAYLQPFELYGFELERASLTARNVQGGDAAWTYDPRESGGDIYLAAGTLDSVAGPLEYRTLAADSMLIDYEDFSVLHPGLREKGSAWVLAFAPDDLLQPSGETGPYGSNTTWPRLRLFVSPIQRPLPSGFILIASDDQVAEGRAVVSEIALSVGRLFFEPSDTRPALPPVFVVTESVADSLLSGTGTSVESLRAQEMVTSEPLQIPLPGVAISGRIEMPVRAFPTENVVSMIEGSDPELRHEAIVIGAHYDHVGVNPLLDGDTIFNGADDNASGSAAVLAVAEAFAEARRAGMGPRRSIVFLHFTAEEKGLLGSRYYADASPSFPIERTVAMINMDMIGRSDPTREPAGEDYVYVIGSRLLSQELHDIAEGVNELTGVALRLDERFNSPTDPNRFYRRSDQWSFGKHGVPFIFFFTGTHEDYHRPSDEPHHLDYARMTRIARLIFGTSWQLANQDGRPALDGDGF